MDHPISELLKLSVESITNVIDVDVDITELMGAEIYLYIKIGEQNAIAKVSSRSQARAGDTIQVAVEAGRIHLFDKDTQKYIIH